MTSKRLTKAQEKKTNRSYGIFTGFLGLMMLICGCSSKKQSKIKNTEITPDNVELVRNALSDSSNFNSRDWVYINAFTARYWCKRNEIYEDDSEKWDSEELKLDSTWLIGKTIGQLIKYEKELDSERALLGGITSKEILDKTYELNALHNAHREKKDSMNALISVELVEAKLRSSYSSLGVVDLYLQINNVSNHHIVSYKGTLDIKDPVGNVREFVFLESNKSLQPGSTQTIEEMLIFTSDDETELFLQRKLDQYVLEWEVSAIELGDGTFFRGQESEAGELWDSICAEL